MEVLDVKASNITEELIKFKTLLETKEDADLVNQILNRLDQIEVSYDDLYNTKIGKTLKKLTKRKDKDISRKSNKLIEKWKKMIDSKKSSKDKEREENEDKHKEKETFIIGGGKTLPKQGSSGSINLEKTCSFVSTTSTVEYSKIFSEANKKVIETLSSSSLPSLRNSVRKTTYDALLNKEELEEKALLTIRRHAIEIEETVHSTLFRIDDKGSKYLARVKAIASNLQDKKNPDFRTAVLTGSLTAQEITVMDVKKMASTELQTKRQIAEKDSFNSMRSDWLEVHAPVGIGMYTCEKCTGQRTTSKEIQLRGADEPMTLFIRCFDCGNEWRIG